MLRRLVTVVSIMTVVLVGMGCSSDTSTDDASPTPDQGSETSSGIERDGATTTTLAGVESTWSVSLTSQQTQLHTVGAGEELTYGWNQLTGASSVDDRAAEIELLGSVDYTEGSGPWWGFLTVTTDEGVLSFRVDGDAALDPATGDTAFTGSLEVIGGTGRYQDATGAATVTGTRDSALGGQVDFEITMTLAGLPG